MPNKYHHILIQSIRCTYRHTTQQHTNTYARVKTHDCRRSRIVPCAFCVQYHTHTKTSISMHRVWLFGCSSVCVCMYEFVRILYQCACVCVCSCDIYMKASGQVNNQQKKHTSVSARLCCVCVLCWCRKTLWRGEARNSIPFNKHAHTYTHTWAHQFWVLRIICLNWLQFEIELPLIKCINLADY